MATFSRSPSIRRLIMPARSGELRNWDTSRFLDPQLDRAGSALKHVFSEVGRIDQCTRRARLGRNRRLRRFDVAGTKDMKHALAGSDQVVGDDAPMAAPPESFRAHDSAAL